MPKTVPVFVIVPHKFIAPAKVSLFAQSPQLKVEIPEDANSKAKIPFNPVYEQADGLPFTKNCIGCVQVVENLPKPSPTDIPNTWSIDPTFLSTNLHSYTCDL